MIYYYETLQTRNAELVDLIQSRILSITYIREASNAVIVGFNTAMDVEIIWEEDNLPQSVSDRWGSMFLKDDPIYVALNEATDLSAIHDWQ